MHLSMYTFVHLSYSTIINEMLCSSAIVMYFIHLLVFAVHVYTTCSSMICQQLVLYQNDTYLHALKHFIFLNVYDLQ